MGDIDFIRLDSSVKDGGQRIELDVVAGAADVASCMDEFYACMARVRRVEETQPEARLRALEGLVGRRTWRRHAGISCSTASLPPP